MRNNSICMKVRETHDAVSAVVYNRISQRIRRKVEKTIVKCDYLPNILTFCVFFQRK